MENVLVGANTGGLEGLGRQLLILVGDHVHTGGEVVNVGLLTAQIEDADLGVGNTTVEARLGVRLERRRTSVKPIIAKPRISSFSIQNAAQRRLGNLL